MCSYSSTGVDVNAAGDGAVAGVEHVHAAAGALGAAVPSAPFCFQMIKSQNYVGTEISNIPVIYLWCVRGFRDQTTIGVY